MNTAARVERHLERSKSAIEAVQAELRKSYETYQPLTPLDAKIRRDKTLAFAMVQHRESEKALLLSLNGDWHEAKWFPKRWSSSALIISRHSESDRFLVVCMPGWLANEKALPSQPTSPKLSDAIQWSERDLDCWTATTRERVKVHNRLSDTGRKKVNLQLTKAMAG